MNWFQATTNALDGWRNSCRQYEEEMYRIRGWERPESDDVALARARLRNARADYRRVVIGWYFKLLVPMDLGDVVPDEVALLLAEDWDERTKGPTP